MPFKVKFKANFIETMKKRAADWAAQPSMSFTIVVPPELDWWFYQEFGIPHSYDIVGNPGIAFPGVAGIIVRKQVTHPGLEPTHTVGTVAASLDRSLSGDLRLAFSASNYDPSITKEKLREVMEKIKQDIVFQMAEDLPGTRQDGKLHGKTAAQVFDENATIVEG